MPSRLRPPCGACKRGASTTLNSIKCNTESLKLKWPTWEIVAVHYTVAHTIERERNIYLDTKDPLVLESIIDHLKLLYRHLLAFQRMDDDLLNSVAFVIVLLEHMAEDTNRDRVTSRRLLRGNMGRPRFDIEQDQLEYLLDLCFTCPDIARLLGVSLRTVRRRMEEFGICVRDRYSSISDAELDEELVSIKQVYPNAGIKTVSGN